MDVLNNKSYKDYSYTSRYSPFPYYYHTKDGKYTYGVTAYLDDTTVYHMHTVVQGDTIDKLALHYYNNPTLFWVICSFNRIRNPYVKLTVGQQLKIPSIANIKYDMDGRSVL